MVSGLEIKDLYYNVQNKTIIQDLSFALPTKESCLITGASGCGKTTLLSLLAGITTPSSGSVSYDGMSLYDMSVRRRDAFRRQNIALMFQRFHLVKSLNVLQNIEVLGAISDKKYDASYVSGLLERLGLEDKKQQKISSLSVGEQQRLSLIRCLAMRPKWLLCDEPTSALDDDNAKIMLDLLSTETQKIGASLIIVTHDERVKNALPYDYHLNMEGIT